MTTKNNKIDGFIKNPKKALFTVATPIVLGMLVRTLYNVVDTAFVGRLGPDSIAAITFSFPIFFIFIAINMGLGAGMGSQISRYLGAKNKTAAENTAMHGLLIALSISLIMFIIGSIFVKDIFIVLGATGNVLTLSIDYMKIILFGIFFLSINNMISQIFSGEGETKIPMMIQTGSLLLNMILDPIFIYGLHLGVKGAAIATVMSMIIGTIFSLIFMRKKSYLHIHPEIFKFSKKIIKKIFAVGLPASLSMLLMSLYFMSINKFVAHFSTDHVAAIGIASRVESIATMPIVGVAMALMTLVGMFYGAKKYNAMKQTILYAFKTGLLYSITMTIIFFIFPTPFLKIFTTNPYILEISKNIMRIWVFSWPFFLIMFFTNRILQGLGIGLPGLVLNIIRVIGISIPISYVLIFVLGKGYLSVPIGMLIGVFISSIAAVIILIKKMKELKLNLEIKE